MVHRVQAFHPYDQLEEQTSYLGEERHQVFAQVSIGKPFQERLYNMDGYRTSLCDGLM